MLLSKRLTLCLLAAALFAFGCSESQPAVNRVQPGALRKSEFVGSTFYMRQTVIDTPYSLSRVRTRLADACR